MYNQLCQLWKDNVLADNQDGVVLSVNKWLARLTRDVIGQGAPHASVRVYLTLIPAKPLSTSTSERWTTITMKSAKHTTTCCESWREQVVFTEHLMCDKLAVASIRISTLLPGTPSSERHGNIFPLSSLTSLTTFPLESIPASAERRRSLATYRSN